LQEQISRLPNISTFGGERNEAIDHCLAGIARLSAEVKDASSYVPAYDQRTYAEAIKALSEKLQNTRASFAPKTKFAFSKAVHKNPSAVSANDSAEPALQSRLKLAGHSNSTSAESSMAPTPLRLHSPANESQTDNTKDPPAGEAEDPVNELLRNLQDNGSGVGVVRKPSFSRSTRISFSNHKGLHIILPPSASHATSTSGTLSNLRNCIVDMSVPTSFGVVARPFAGLTLRDISDSLIVSGRVAGPMHITNMRDSVLVVACRQFRMHDSRSVDVYLHCGSRPIIEDCDDVRFAPLPSVYETEEINGEGKGGVAGNGNFWDQVDDFKWLKSEPSPHWRILEQSERVEERVWTEIVPGKPGIGVEDLLAAVKEKSRSRR
jgi:tubulin-specific chaperone C